MKKNLYKIGLLSFLGLGVYSHAQTAGLNTTAPKATLDVRAANASGTTNEGIIAPILTKTRVANIATPIEGTLVYVENVTYTGNDTKVAKITEKGYYFYNGTEWVPSKDTNTTYTGSTSVALNGTSFERAALMGDVTAATNSNATTVTAIQGKAVAPTSPTSGEVLKWNGTQWAPAADNNTFEDEEITKIVMGNSKSLTDIMPNETFYTVESQISTRGGAYYRYTGHSITLPPGKWLLFYGYLIAANEPFGSSKSVWFRAIVSDNSTSEIVSNQAAFVVDGSQAIISASLTPYQWYQSGTGTYIVNNSSGSSKTYFMKISLEPSGFTTEDSKKVLALGQWGEEFLYAVKIR